MSTALIEQIAAKIVARLNNIKKANDYDFDVLDVARPLQLGKYVGVAGQIYEGVNWDRLCLVAQNQKIDRDTEWMSSGPNVGRKLDFGIFVFVVPNDANATPLDTINNQRSAAVEKAITTRDDDNIQWDLFGGLTGAANFLSIERLGTQPTDPPGILLTLEVQYRHPETDPYNAA